MNRSGFSELSLKGIIKVADILIPGDEERPSFSKTSFISELYRMTDFMNQDDKAGLKLLTTLLGLMPSFLIRLFLIVVFKHHLFPGILGSLLRQIEIGLKGIVMTLYYSNLDEGAANPILKTIHYNSHINSLGKDSHMEQLLHDQNPLSKSSTLSAKEVFERTRSASSEIRGLSVNERLKYITRIREVVLKKQESIIDKIQAETRKARTDILTSEIFPLMEHLAFLEARAVSALADEKVPTPVAMLGKTSKIFFEPLGTILVISPWNYPFYQAIVPITCSFITGNATVYKPSEITPLTGLVEMVLREAGMKDTWVQVVYGDGKTGRELIHQRPQKIFFTGSVATGKKIMSEASQFLIPTELELGGKDPMIVFEDANLERSVKGATWGAFTNSGQSCTSVERLYVQESIFEEFKAKLVAEVKSLKLGVDQSGDSDMGEMISEKQVEIVADLVADAINQGAKLLTGESWDFKSRIIPPMVIEGTTHAMRINKEEIFGPVLPLMKFKTEAEAIELANDSDFGLSASVWTKDKERALRVSRNLFTGNISVNNVMLSEGNHDLPFGGVKDSGIGRYKGVHGLRSFCNLKSVLIDADSKKIEANWYPYTSKKYSLFNGLTQSLFGGGLKKWFGLVRFGLPLESLAQKKDDRTTKNL
jgi:acyl-CoA reductase-like NAD-dependent aldehyde dehydrogenase